MVKNSVQETFTVNKVMKYINLKVDERKFILFFNILIPHMLSFTMWQRNMELNGRVTLPTGKYCLFHE